VQFPDLQRAVRWFASGNEELLVRRLAEILNGHDTSPTYAAPPPDDRRATFENPAPNQARIRLLDSAAET